MLIRSQDKKTIVNMSNIDTIEVYGCQMRYYCVGVDTVGLLGQYSTEEKAIKVLDMIQDAYARCESSRALTTGTVFEIARESKTQEVVEDFKKGHRDNFVFQMPQDSEV